MGAFGPAHVHPQFVRVSPSWLEVGSQLGLSHPSMCRFPCDTEGEHNFLSEFLAGDSYHGYSAVLSPGAIPGDELPDIRSLVLTFWLGMEIAEWPPTDLNQE